MVLLQSEPLSVGWSAPDFKLKATDEKEYSLSDFKSKKGLLIAFTCNHCPYARAAWPLLIELYKLFNNDIEFIAINSNDAKNFPEDSFEQMKVKKQEWGIPFTYLHDETQTVAKNYQAKCTPDLYFCKLNQGEPELYYHGRINDNWQEPQNVEEKNLELAIQGLVENKPAPENQPPSMGCSIKWK